MNREDFPMLEKDIVYFDNGATTLKPRVVVVKMDEYMQMYTSNIHRGDYDAAIKTNQAYDGVRKIVSEFINCSEDEVIFTSGTTMSLNTVVFGYMKKHLKKGDEVIISKAEHASNVLPWMKLSEDIGIVIKYAPLNDNMELTVENIEKTITEKTKVISIAHVTNVIGDVRDIKAIGKICRERGILFNVDGAQSVPHMKVDFREANIDFLSFSGHKMCGPTGVGVLVVKSKLMEDMDPLCYGGGMNQTFEATGDYELKTGPSKFEAGTPPIAEVIGLGEAIKYLEKIGLDNIHKHEVKLKKLLVKELEKIPNIILYNTNSDSGILSFNIDSVFAQDSSVYLNNYNIYVRAGNHCAKILKDEMKIKNTVRVSMYFYNNEEDVLKLVDVLKRSEDIFRVVI